MSGTVRVFWPVRDETYDVKISDQPRTARVAHDLVVPREGGRARTWDGDTRGGLYVLKDAGTDSGIMAHPISGEDRMDPSELRAVRERMGLSLDQMAALLRNQRGGRLNPRTLRDFESGTVAIPEQIRERADDLWGMTETALGKLEDDWAFDRFTSIDVYRGDDDFHAAHPEYRAWPARWWLHVAARFAANQPTVRLRTVED
ncbi:hypothetical protein MYK68_15815 [Gordonia sp. PP30]|uniref:helix-turn-helix domain-containing protein n=1 Tax=Gordonia sp. PP30 TaxID=2935861 RepID=UPI001FFFC08B|nr:hypothetical protein [Gordonia sp. PP30]UQE74179.1 hypothetical protein MYK68_15815 [Gordonia sp. PP30]